MRRTTPKIVDQWFQRRRVDSDITLLWEPYVVALDRCNIWHVHGRNRDLLVDSGMGIVGLREAARDLFAHQTLAVATHSHYDHTGNFHEFEHRIAHQAEAEAFVNQALQSLRVDAIPNEFRKYFERVGYGLDSEYLISAVPDQEFDIEKWRQTGVRPTWFVEKGDVLDLGNRAFEVLHLPGHSPGSIGLWEISSRILFSGDAIYDGPLLDELPESDIQEYVRTMKRLLRLPVSVVHGGHGPSFDGDRLRKLAHNFLSSHDA